MRGKRFTDEHIVSILKESSAGVKTENCAVATRNANAVAAASGVDAMVIVYANGTVRRCDTSTGHDRELHPPRGRRHYLRLRRS